MFGPSGCLETTSLTLKFILWVSFSQLNSFKEVVFSFSLLLH